MWECEWWRLYKTSTNVKQRVREKFAYRVSLAAEHLLEGRRNGKIFGYVQCDLEVPEMLRDSFANLARFSMKTLVSGNHNINLMKTSAEEEGTMFQPVKLVISSLTLQNGTLITPLLLFYLDSGLVCRKIQRSIYYTP